MRRSVGNLKNNLSSPSSRHLSQTNSPGNAMEDLPAAERRTSAAEACVATSGLPTSCARYRARLPSPAELARGVQVLADGTFQ